MNRMNFHEMEDNLARELQRRKLENESKKKEIEKILGENQELKELRQKIKLGYLNKERSTQIAEKQMRLISDIVFYLTYFIYLHIFEQFFYISIQKQI